MKTFKTRGKDINGEWRYGQLLVVDGYPHIIEEWDMCCDGHHIRQESDRPTWVDENTVGHFIGRLDDDGNEIYEGDIIDVHIPKNAIGKEEHRKRVVVWNEEISGFELADWNTKKCVYDRMGAYAGQVFHHVIGNIHDNPDLLGGQELFMAGDYFYRPGYYDKVTEVRKNGIIGSEKYVIIPYSDVRPIKLSEEMFKRNGFELKTTNGTQELVGLDGRISVRNDADMLNTNNKFLVHVDNEDMDTIMACEVTYVHQFQQMLRLCGIEIDFKP